MTYKEFFEYAEKTDVYSFLKDLDNSDWNDYHYFFLEKFFDKTQEVKDMYLNFLSELNRYADNVYALEILINDFEKQMYEKEDFVPSFYIFKSHYPDLDKETKLSDFVAKIIKNKYN